MSNEEIDGYIEGTPFTWRQALIQGNTGVLAIPLSQHHDNIIRQAVALVPVYYLLGGFTITSWLRTEEHNKAIGGSIHSAHLVGLATDFVPTKMTPDEARAKIKAAGVYPGRTELDAKTWCHYDLMPGSDFYARPK